MENSNKENIENREGRPPIGHDKLMDIVCKLSPYLRTGLSIRKAVLQFNADSKNGDNISYVTVYKYHGVDEEFTNRIDAEMHYLSVVTSNIFYNILKDIAKKQEEGSSLTKEDMENIKWFAMYSKSTRQEFGSRSEVDLGNKDDKPLQLSTPKLDAWFDNLVKKEAEKINEEQRGMQGNTESNQG